VKVYGVFQFDGLEKSPLGGFTNLMDLMTFRQLYGYLTAEKLEELQALKAASGAKDLSREEAETALFGESRPLSETAQQAPIDESQMITHREPLAERSFTQDDLDHGVVLNAAVMFQDVTHLPERMEKVLEAAKAAGLSLKILSWQDASGLIGQ